MSVSTGPVSTARTRMPPRGQQRAQRLGQGDELTTALEDWIKLWNEAARPFTWTKTPDQIIDRICRYCSRISEPGH